MKAHIELIHDGILIESGETTSENILPEYEIIRI